MSLNFPTALWGITRVRFVPDATAVLPNVPFVAALVFAMHNDGFVLADITDRGWCIPSGRIESGETPEETARREAWEEAGLTLGPLIPVGITLLQKETDKTISAAVNYFARVEKFEPIPAESEARGVRVVMLDEIPECYFQWDDLLKAIFEYVWASYKAWSTIS